MMNRLVLAALVSAFLPLASFRAAAQPAAKPAGAPATNDVQPTPRLPDGKVDFGGKGVWAPIWVLDWADKKWVSKAVDVPFKPEGLEIFKERRANNSKDDPEGYCLPAGVPRYTGTPYPFQIIQLPDRVVILGHWEGTDTLVIDTVAFNGRTWLDYVGHPASDQLHVIERLRRPDFRTLVYEATIEDPKFYTKPWTTSFNVKFQPGWEIKEYVCLENNKDLLHLGTKEPK
jgi:hypothetical protein